MHFFCRSADYSVKLIRRFVHELHDGSQMLNWTFQEYGELSSKQPVLENGKAEADEQMNSINNILPCPASHNR